MTNDAAHGLMPLPAGASGRTITLDQASAAVGAFGYELVMRPKAPASTADQVEAAARAMHDHNPPSPRLEDWDDLDDTGHRYWLDKARVALAAAAGDQP